MSFFDRIGETLESMPEWARPPFYGMLFVYAMMVYKAALVLPLVVITLLIGGPESVLVALWLLLAAGLAGFAGGLAFAIAHPALRRLGRSGVFLTWWLATFAYLATVIPLVSSHDGSASDFDLRSPAAWVILGALSIFFGSILGRIMSASGSRRRRVWVQRKQRVTSRVHPRAEATEGERNPTPLPDER